MNILINMQTILGAVNAHLYSAQIKVWRELA